MGDRKRHVRRDGQLVVGGMFLGLAMAELVDVRFVAGAAQLVMGLIVVALAVTMKR